MLSVLRLSMLFLGSFLHLLYGNELLLVPLNACRLDKRLDMVQCKTTQRRITLVNMKNVAHFSMEWNYPPVLCPRVHPEFKPGQTVTSCADGQGGSSLSPVSSLGMRPNMARQVLNGVQAPYTLSSEEQKRV
jgi:hypothetical protein